MSELRFDRGPHRYWLGKRRLPSVSEVVSETGLVRDHTWTNPYYRVRGSAVHDAIRLRLLGLLDEDSLDNHTRPFIQRFDRFAETVNLIPLFLEEPLHCPIFYYAGTPDFFGLVNDYPTLLDWKCGPYEPGYSVQVAGGYMPLIEAAADQAKIPVSVADAYRAKIAVVPLNRSLPSPVWLGRDGLRELFRSALAIHNWRQTQNIGVVN
jgi:hypothetical protein